ncbi:hypothetical protein PMIN06_010233 [Paraphaeosphaeria minitans]
MRVGTMLKITCISISANNNSLSDESTMASDVAKLFRIAAEVSSERHINALIEALRCTLEALKRITERSSTYAATVASTGSGSPKISNDRPLIYFDGRFRAREPLKKGTLLGCYSYPNDGMLNEDAIASEQLTHMETLNVFFHYREEKGFHTLWIETSEQVPSDHPLIRSEHILDVEEVEGWDPPADTILFQCRKRCPRDEVLQVACEELARNFPYRRYSEYQINRRLSSNKNNAHQVLHPDSEERQMHDALAEMYSERGSIPTEDFVGSEAEKAYFTLAESECFTLEDGAEDGAEYHHLVSHCKYYQM